VPKKYLKRIVLLIEDVSTISGIQTRTLKTVRNSGGRDVEYICISAFNDKGNDIIDGFLGNCLTVGANTKEAIEVIKSWRPEDTVIWFSNKTLSRFPADVRKALEKFPLIFVGAGQLSFHIQNGRELQDLEFVQGLRASGVMLLSHLDKMTYNQFGIYGQKVGFNPVEIRNQNNWSFRDNRVPTYIGRISNGTKGTDRLIPIARFLANRSLGPLRVYTPSSSTTSGELDRFLNIVRKEGVEDMIDIRFDERELDVMLGQASVVFLPSRQEAFGNVILEAYSYGVPVVSSAYAPGPSELIAHGKTGFLFEEYNEAELENVFATLEVEDIAHNISACCFERHKDYAIEKYYTLIESYSAEILQEFDGSNSKAIFPHIPRGPKTYTNACE